MAVDKVSLEWLGCVVCGDDGDFVAVADHASETEVMCARCGQARLVPVLGDHASPQAPSERTTVLRQTRSA